MASALSFLPLAAALALLGLLAVADAVRPVDRTFDRVSWALFDGTSVERDIERQRTLRSAGIGTPYELYQTRTLLYSGLAALAGVVLGGYAAAAVIEVLNVSRLTTPVGGELFRPLPDALLTFDAKYFALLTFGGILLAAASAGVVYLVRWKVPSVRADTRRRQIDAGMPRTIAFVYALSRGGMSFPEVMRTLSRNRDVFGTGAEEMRIAARDIDLFGADLVSAVRDLANRTPSDRFQSFSENLTSVLQSGQDLSAFLHEEYERYTDAAEEQQGEILNVLATAAEVYVTVVVAGTLFLLTILLIIGLTRGGMLFQLRVITYVLLPATNVLFIAYLSEVTQPLRASRTERPDEEAEATTSPAVAADGGALPTGRVRENLARLALHRRLARVRRFATDPVATLRDTPRLLLYVTVPVAALFVGLQYPAYYVDGRVVVTVLDDVLVQATLFVLVTFGIVYELHRRRLERLEAAVPDLLERLASLNEAGLSVVASFERVRRSDVGALDDEVERIWRDIQWGATVEQALDRFEERARTPSITRVVTLLTNSMRASNEIGPVLRIAAEQARSDQRLKRHRRQETATYLVVIYIAFFVFLVVIGALDLVLIPALPDGSAAGGNPLGGFGGADQAAYRLVFFHAVIVQAALSGLVGGQMSDGSIEDGLKHASVMLFVAYVAFLVTSDLELGGAVAATLLP
jgi:flagellar protein FlaJ